MFDIDLHCTYSISYVMYLTVYDICYKSRQCMLC